MQSLKKPRKVVILVKAGAGTEAVIDELAALFEPGDIIIDGGNANWNDTIAREKRLREKGLRFIGSGVSGGEEGARFGPSLMPGGAIDAWKELEPVWRAIAAKVDPKTGKPIPGAAPGKPVQGGVPCTAYIGADGAGHYVKMVHNGIEYGDMQMICEAFDLLQRLLGLAPAAVGDIFAKWNTGVLDSFLIEISADVLRQKDPVTGRPFVDIVLDTAGQKGTGKWTSQSALDMGVPAPTVAEAVFARCISAIKEERVAASKILQGPAKKFSGNAGELVQAVHDALYCSKICSYAQGFQLMREAQKEYHWTLNFGEIAQIWRGGCIIRAAFLQKITEAYALNANLANLLLDPYFCGQIAGAQENWRRVVALGAEFGVPMPSFSAARWRITTATGPSACRRICCKASGTFSARTPTSAWTSRAANSSTLTGPTRSAHSCRREAPGRHFIFPAYSPWNTANSAGRDSRCRRCAWAPRRSAAARCLTSGATPT